LRAGRRHGQPGGREPENQRLPHSPSRKQSFLLAES
jgi:hypothetical protein